MIAPVRWHRVGGRGGWHPGVERGVEAGNLHDIGHRGSHLGKRRQRRRLVQRRQRGQRGQLLGHPVGDDDRIDERCSAVHDPVPDRAECAQPGQVTDSRTDLARVRAARPGAEIDRGQHAVIRPEEAKFQAGRPRVDHQNVHGTGQSQRVSRARSSRRSRACPRRCRGCTPGPRYARPPSSAGRARRGRPGPEPDR